MNTVASEIASTISTASVTHHPDPRYDLNPSTSTSRKTPVRLDLPPPAATSSAADVSSPLSPPDTPTLRPIPRRRDLPPLPDLRFEQSYLARIATYTTWQSILYVTVLDQVLLPLSQGFMWNLLLHGWRAWNARAAFQGAGVGAKVRRWWWGVNGWKLPGERGADAVREPVVQKRSSQLGPVDRMVLGAGEWLRGVFAPYRP